MGAFASKRFKRRDDVQGQGKDVLIKAKKLRLRRGELNRLYHEFNKLEGTSGFIDLQEFYIQHNLPTSILLDFLMRQFDLLKSGRLYFIQYLVTVWNLMTLNDEATASFMFAVFNPSRSTALDIIEIKYIIKLIFDFKVPSNIQKIMKKLDDNIDGVITLGEFILFIKCHPSILNPIREIRKKIQANLVHPYFWRVQTRRRHELFDLSMNIYSIIGWYDENSIVQNLEWLAEENRVPRSEVQAWRQYKIKVDELALEPLNLPYELLNDEEKDDLPFGGEGWKPQWSTKMKGLNMNNDQKSNAFGNGFGLEILKNATANKYPKSRYFSGTRPDDISNIDDEYDNSDAGSQSTGKFSSNKGNIINFTNIHTIINDSQIFPQ